MILKKDLMFVRFWKTHGFRSEAYSCFQVHFFIIYIHYLFFILFKLLNYLNFFAG